MKLLKMYCLEGKGLTPEQLVQIKDALGLDHIVQVRANNQLENIQYPVFEFDEIYTTEEVLSCNISRDDVKVIYDNTVRRFSNEII